MRIHVLLAQVGAPTESDVLLAQTAGAAILAFGVNPPGAVKKKAEEKGVLLKTFRIIYDLIDEVRSMVKGQKEPQYKEEVLGRAEVRAVFRLPTGRQVAGCMVLQGRIPRSARCGCCARGRRSGRAASEASSASRRTCGRWPRGTSAAWASRALTTSRKGTS